jgi:phage head maturation protease
VERLPAVLVLVQRALEHAGMADTFRLLPDLDQESAARGAKAYPETSAQHHALWAAIMASMIRKKPLEAQRYIDAAEVSAALALAAPIAEPTQTGVKSVQETTTDDGTIGLLLSGYATRWGETDLAGEIMTREAFHGIKDEWGAAKRPSVAFNHGQDPAIGFRPIGECTRWQLDDGGLKVDIFVPREPDPKRFSGAALLRYKDIYRDIAAGNITGLSIAGAYTREAQGRSIKHWALGEVSITDRPCLPSATFVLRP